MTEKAASPMLLLHPSRGLIDEKFSLIVQNLSQIQDITLHALIHSDDGDYWEAFGHYVSDATGFVNVANDSSLGGTYDGVEPMGLLWSMRPVPGSRIGLRLRKKEVHTPMVVHISVYRGHMSQGFREQVALASVVTERWYMAPGVRRVDITEGGITGTLFLPPGPGPFPALLDLWGGGGGLVEYRSALLSSHGFVSLALEYMTPRTSGGSTSHVGNEYFEAAFTVLKQHPQVCGDSIAILGLSFGTSVALGMAVYSTVIQPRCLVCVSGSHVQPVKGSLSDVFGEINKNVRNTRYDEENRVIWRDLLLPIPTDPTKKVDVGQLKCPVLMIVGEDDQNWPATESAEDMKQMMEKAGNSHLLTTLSYPGAGHLIEPPYSPHIRASNFMVAETKQKLVVLWGGETAPHGHAQEDSWKKILSFLEEHLYRSTDVTSQSNL
ncbi:bile acid-CoA:amino acid N-acyltransferase isoform X1 [Oncorhynchus mykiss]|nr:bile acid-CoA:amino acid N-acyltransferase isoform X1 [Oncorhynchus mykiss]XP_021454489.2 bile acid-CoA:amino acid N-acyltransferase isoform X1 [Oncorhynchus mykiss]XP_021454490.2 bile acid-CoA:amino acid N-acyltransferase isoform X1 [Oncorhynchus mykiss]